MTATKAGHKIVIAQNDGTHVRPLGSGDESQISGDGARVAILSTTGLTDHCEFGPLRVVPSAGGAALAVPGNFCLRSLVWSPDSRRIAVVRVDSPTAETLLTADPATGSVSAIATGIFDRPSFSPDSTRLAYVQYPDASRLRRGGTLRVIGLATHVITTLRGRASTPIWVRGRSRSRTSCRTGSRASCRGSPTSPSCVPTVVASVSSRTGRLTGSGSSPA